MYKDLKIWNITFTMKEYPPVLPWTFLMSPLPMSKEYIREAKELAKYARTLAKPWQISRLEVWLHGIWIDLDD